MLISLNWLNDYVDLSDLSAERIAELLSLHTAEVEGIEEVGAAIADVVVGEVLERAQHSRPQLNALGMLPAVELDLAAATKHTPHAAVVRAQ